VGLGLYCERGLERNVLTLFSFLGNGKEAIKEEARARQVGSVRSKSKWACLVTMTPLKLLVLKGEERLKREKKERKKGRERKEKSSVMFRSFFATRRLGHLEHHTVYYSTYVLCCCTYGEGLMAGGWSGEHTSLFLVPCSRVCFVLHWCSRMHGQGGKEYQYQINIKSSPKVSLIFSKKKYKKYKKYLLHVFDLAVRS